MSKSALGEKDIFVQSEQNDASTHEVLSWVTYLSKNVQVIHANDSAIIKTFTYDINGTEEVLKLKLSDDQEINSKKVRSRWYRRGTLNFESAKVDKESEWSFQLSSRLLNHLAADFSSLLKGIDRKFDKSQNSINKFSDNYTSKIDNLLAARSCGLEIPETIITNNLEDLRQFVDRCGKVITKPFGTNTIKIRFKDSYIAVLSSDTSEVNLNTMKARESYYQQFASLPSLYQKYIVKKYELRIFILMDRFYPMAIFSQGNSKTELDFRNYDKERPNRCTPYVLPEAIAFKLKSFMAASNMNCGSVDMIVTPDNRYVFLEVNPIGQFQWLSRSCNYDIERTIAQTLLSEYEEK